MTHLKLIETINRHKEIIDKAYNNQEITEVPPALVESGIFRKVGKEIRLTDTYIQFANTMLMRADAVTAFGNYAEEQKLLLENKKAYLKKRDSVYLDRMIHLSEKLYERLYDRDNNINARISDIISDNKLSIEVVIKDAEDIDSRIDKMIDENNKIRSVLNDEIKGIDKQLDELIMEIGLDMERLNNNIHTYIYRLNDFILGTKKRKEQNDKLFSLSNKIMKEKDEDLEAVLLSNSQNYHHVIKDSKNNIRYMPREKHIEKDTFISALRNTMNIKKEKRNAPSDASYDTPLMVTVEVVKFESLLESVKKHKPEDIYDFISSHSEITKFDNHKKREVQSFKAYLTIVLEHTNNIRLTEEFNKNKIRIVKWI